MSAESMTAHRHNDYVGGDASLGRIPGADQATTGHQYNAIFPKGGAAANGAAPKSQSQEHHPQEHHPQEHHSQEHHPQEQRPQEHLPQSTGRDATPEGGVRPIGKHINAVIPGDQLRNGQTDDLHHANPGAHRIQAARTTGQPVELAPAPDSRTVVDRDPYAPPTAVGDTLTGATSKDVYNHLGHPGTGQTSSELRHDGQHGRERAPRGNDQFGSGAIPREAER